MKVTWGLKLVSVSIVFNAKTEVICLASFGRLFHALMVDGKKESENKLEFDLKH